MEAVREKFNPVQHALIPAHITLCREQELKALEKVLERLTHLAFPSFSLPLGKPTRFHDANGVYLPITGDLTPFYQLRNILLQGIVSTPETPMPHVTLMHPRNSNCDDRIFDEICTYPFPGEITLDRISFITQLDGQAWEISKEFYLVP